MKPMLSERVSLSFVVALITFFGFFYTPIWDSDFWWHIASGRWIVEHGSIPTSDPFGVYSNSDTIRNDTVLRAQWLGQVILYSVYRVADEAGIIFLRASILALSLLLLVWRARALGAPRWTCWAILIPSGLIALGFTSDRPQLFSYLFAPIVFLLVERYERMDKSRWLIPIPIIAVFWANIHGGFLIVAAALALYAGTAWANEIRHAFLRRGAMRRDADARKEDVASGAHHHALLAVALAFIAFSLLSANGLTTYRYLVDLEGANVQQATSEYISAFKLYQLGYVIPQIWVAVIYVAGVISFAGLYKTAPAKLAVLLFLGAVSALHYRYFAFVVFIAGPYIALGLSSVKTNALKPKLESVVTTAIGVIAAVLLVIGIVNRWALRGGVNETMFPVAATKVLRQHDGKIFNHMQWGGYLIWHLYPYAQVYIDGRVLDRDKFDRYTHILWATPSGIDLLRQEQFEIVMLPLRNRFTGERYPLPNYLERTERWDVIYQDADTRVYRRRQ